MPTVKVACFVSRFPHFYQTFIRREINELVRQGARVEVFPVTGPRRGGHRDAVNAPAEGPLQLHHVSLRRLDTWRRALRSFGQAPRLCLARALELLRATAMRPATLLKSWAALVKGLAWAELIAREGYTHLHAHWSTYPTTAARIVSDLTGIPFSFAFHAYDIFATRILIPEKIEQASFVIVNCRYTRDVILETYPAVDRDKLILIYNSLDLPRYQALARAPDPERPLVLAIGQLVPTKGFEVLIEAVARLAAEGPPLRLVLAGAGPLRAALAAAAADRGLADRVTFAGEQTEAQIREWLTRATMLVMPCVTPPRGGAHDALPNVIIEALAAGVPVVASRVFGIPEVVRHESTGLLVAERDPAALAAAMGRLLADPEWAARLAARGKRLAAERFDGHRNASRLMDLFQTASVAARPRGTPARHDR